MIRSTGRSAVCGVPWRRVAGRGSGSHRGACRRRRRGPRRGRRSWAGRAAGSPGVVLALGHRQAEPEVYARVGLRSWVTPVRATDRSILSPLLPVDECPERVAGFPSPGLRSEDAVESLERECFLVPASRLYERVSEHVQIGQRGRLGRLPGRPAPRRPSRRETSLRVHRWAAVKASSPPRSSVVVEVQERDQRYGSDR